MNVGDMAEQSSWDRIHNCGVIAIIRGDYSVEEILAMGGALLAGGISVMEVTCNSRHAMEAITVLARNLGPEGALIGAGTVRRLDQVNAVYEAGASFLVSPNLDLDVVRRAQFLKIPHLPGVLTPTEIESAARAGCRVVKLFPADNLPPSYVKALQGPFEDVDFVPTGGVTLENVAEYRRAGSYAVGVGGEITRHFTTPDSLVERSRLWRNAWDEATEPVAV